MPLRGLRPDNSIAARGGARECGKPHGRDAALTPVDEKGDAILDLLTKTTGAAAAVAHIKKVAALTGTGNV